MNSVLTIQRFHGQLISIDLAGLAPIAKLLQLDVAPRLPNEEDERSENRQDLLLYALESKAKAAGLLENGNAIESIGGADGSQLTDPYLSCLRNWLAGNQQIDALEHLVLCANAERSTENGFRAALVYLVAYGLFGLFTLTVLLGLTLGKIGAMVRHMYVPAHWLLEFLIDVQPYWPVLLVLYLAGMVGATIRLARNRSRQSQLQSDEIYRWLALSTSGDHSGAQQLSRGNIEKLPIKQGLPEWAARQLQADPTNSHYLKTVQNLYRWLSTERARWQANTHPLMLGVAVGGVTALFAGLLLFYPLVQTLITVIESSEVLR